MRTAFQCRRPDPHFLCSGTQDLCASPCQGGVENDVYFRLAHEKAGSIFVKRGERDIDSFKQCMRVLKAGEKLIVFPEGTRVHGDAVVEPKSGVIHMAVRMHVPIVPVYIPRDKKIFHEVPTVIGEPYYPELGDHRDYDRLARELMERIWALKPEE